MAAAVVVSPIPSVPLDIVAGSIFGPVLGTVYATLGGLIGAMLSFIIARALGRQLLERFLGGHINFCQACSNRLLAKIVLVSRLLPLVSFDVVSYGAGPASVLFSTIAVGSGVSGALFFSPFFMLVVGLVPVQAIGAGLLTEVFGMGNGLRSYVRAGTVGCCSEPCRAWWSARCWPTSFPVAFSRSSWSWPDRSFGFLGTGASLRGMRARRSRDSVH